MHLKSQLILLDYFEKLIKFHTNVCHCYSRCSCLSSAPCFVSLPLFLISSQLKTKLSSGVWELCEYSCVIRSSSACSPSNEFVHSVSPLCVCGEMYSVLLFGTIGVSPCSTANYDGNYSRTTCCSVYQRRIYHFIINCSKSKYIKYCNHTFYSGRSMDWYPSKPYLHHLLV